MKNMFEKFKNLSKTNKILSYTAGGLLVFGLILILVGLFSDGEPTQAQLQRTTERSLQEAEEILLQDDGNDYILELDLEGGIQIIYEENIQTYKIIIMSIARDGLSDAEFQTLREDIETYFLEEILETSNERIACALNVTIFTLGDEEPTLAPSPLSFCE